MKHEVIRSSRRKPVNLSIDPALVGEAKNLGLNISRITEDALRSALRDERESRWAEEHKERIDAFSGWLDKHGMPFEELRLY